MNNYCYLNIVIRMSSGKMQPFIPSAVKGQTKAEPNLHNFEIAKLPPRKSAHVFDYLIFCVLFCHLRITDYTQHNKCLLSIYTKGLDE